MPLLQAFLCIRISHTTLILLLPLALIILQRRHKVFFSNSEIFILLAALMLNIYYYSISLSGGVYLKYTYVLLLSIFFSKVVFPNVDEKTTELFFSRIYYTITFFLVIEYVYILFFGNSFFIENLSCYSPGVIGYKNISAYSILPIFGVSLNSIILGSQTASQLSLFSLVWFYTLCKSRYKYCDHKMIITIALIMLVIISPSNTSIFLLVIYMFFLYFYMHGSIKAKKTSKRKLFVLFLMLLFFIYMLIQRYNLFYVFESLILPQINTINILSTSSVFFGIPLKDLDDSMVAVNEIAIINHIVIYGIIGVSVFYYFIFYNMYNSSLFLNYVNARCKSVFAASVFIVILSIFSLIHYPVIFQTGFIELLSIHIAYILHTGNYKKY